MLKSKKILLVIILLIGLLLPSMVKATDDEITIDRITASTDGSISFVIKGLELDNTSNYEWNIEKIITTEKENWYQVTAPDYENGEIRIDVNASNEKQLEVLKSVDNAYISIRKTGETELILEDEKVDLILPLLSTYKVTKSTWYGSAPTNPAYEVRTIYGMNEDNVVYCFDKITDADLVNNYIDNNHNLEGLNLATISEIPDLADTRWKSVNKKGNVFSYSEIENIDLPTEDGLYYLWLKGNDSENGVKTIYGYTIIEIGEVKKIDKTNTDNSNTDNSNTDNSNTDNSNTDNDNDTKKPDDTSGTTNTKNTTNTTDKDNTVATSKLPNTGKVMLAWIIAIIAISAIVAHVRYKKLYK